MTEREQANQYELAEIAASLDVMLEAITEGHALMQRLRQICEDDSKKGETKQTVEGASGATDKPAEVPQSPPTTEALQERITGLETLADKRGKYIEALEATLHSSRRRLARASYLLNAMGENVAQERDDLLARARRANNRLASLGHAGYDESLAVAADLGPVA